MIEQSESERIAIRQMIPKTGCRMMALFDRGRIRCGVDAFGDRKGDLRLGIITVGLATLVDLTEDRPPKLQVIARKDYVESVAAQCVHEAFGGWLGGIGWEMGPSDPW